jgi:hypothetical protein
VTTFGPASAVGPLLDPELEPPLELVLLPALEDDPELDPEPELEPDPELELELELELPPPSASLPSSPRPVFLLLLQAETTTRTRETAPNEEKRPDRRVCRFMEALVSFEGARRARGLSSPCSYRAVGSSVRTG